MNLSQPFLAQSVRCFQPLPEALKWRVGRKLVGLLRKHSAPGTTTRIRCKDGFDIEVQLEDWLGSHVAVWREYESGLSEIIRSSVHPGEHFVDVGANIGYFSLLGAVCVGEAGKVTAIEASPLNYQKLMENISLNEFDSIISCRNCAVWFEETELTLFQGPSQHSGISSVRELEGSTSKYNVAAATIDSLLLDSDERPIKFVKLDVEGAEYQALLGMKKTISTYRPAIALELSEEYLNQLGHNAAEILNFLVKDLGYDLFTYDHRGVEERSDPAQVAEQAKKDQLNILFR